jgi:hypothetical protein
MIYLFISCPVSGPRKEDEYLVWQGNRNSFLSSASLLSSATTLFSSSQDSCEPEVPLTFKSAVISMAKDAVKDAAKEEAKNYAAEVVQEECGCIIS